MKVLMASLAVAALSGCVAYPYGAAPYGSAEVYYSNSRPYYGYGREAPYVVEPRPHYGYDGRWGRGDRDRDGVPNRYDSYPNDPRRY